MGSSATLCIPHRLSESQLQIGGQHFMDDAAMHMWHASARCWHTHVDVRALLRPSPRLFTGTLAIALPHFCPHPPLPLPSPRPTLAITRVHLDNRRDDDDYITTATSRLPRRCHLSPAFSLASPHHHSVRPPSLSSAFASVYLCSSLRSTTTSMVAWPQWNCALRAHPPIHSH